MTIAGAALALLLTAAPSPQAAFEALKSLEGNWTAQSDSGLSMIQYRIVGDGAAVLELALGADRTKIVSATLFRMDGADLVAEVHGKAGAPQQLKLTTGTKAAAQQQRLTFVSKGATSPRLVLSWTRDGALTRQPGASKSAAQFEREYVDRLK